MKLVSSRLSSIVPSITLETSARAAAMRRHGIDVVGLSAGEPDFDTPEHIKEAARKALAAGATKYTDVAGTPELRAAVATELSVAHGLSIQPEQVIVSCGAKHSLYVLFQALLDPGDEVLVPAPYWVSYPDLVLLAGGRPVIVPTTAETGFVPTRAALEAKLTPKTRAIILNFPSNPSGACATRAELEPIARLAVERDLLLVSDDIYRRLTYGDAPYVHVASLGADVAARTVLVDGVSKAYAMTGWRIGYAAAPRELTAAMITLQGQQTSNPASIGQAATVAALQGPQDCVEQMRVEFDRRRIWLVDRLRAIPGVRCAAPGGAFYAFPDVSAYLGRKLPSGGAAGVVDNDVALCRYLLEEGRVAVVPGSGFGAPGYIRLSYATSMAALDKATTRLAEALARLG
jgi:aspartate aminotransferase